VAGHGSERRGTYLRRLAWAAAASLLLHLITFRGLAVSRVGLDADPVAPVAEKPLTPKPKADFQLQVPRSPPTERPAHEKPLDIALKPAAELPTVKREGEPAKAVSERAAGEAAGDVKVTPEQVQRTKIEPDTQRAEAEALARQAAAEASALPAATTADTAAIAPAAAAEAPAQPLPAAVAPRPREAVEPVASRWRPREVALLERLTARTPTSATRSAREALTEDADPAAAAATRSAAEASAAADARADAVAPAPVAAPAATQQPALAPAARQTSRPSQGRAASTTTAAAPATEAETSAVATTSPTARLPSVARIDRAGQLPPAAVAASTAPGRRQATASATSAATAATVATTPAAPTAAAPAAAAPAAAPLARGSAARGPANGFGANARIARSTDAAESASPGTAASAPAGAWVAAGTTGRSARDDANASASAARPAGSAAPLPRGVTSASALDASAAAVKVDAAATGTAAGPALVASAPKPALAPAALGRTSAAARSAVGATRPGGADTLPADADEEEGLSAPSVEAAAIQAAAAGRQRGEPDAPAVAARSLERVAAAALPVEGRVRDVAEAFAKRTPVARQADVPTRKVADPKTLARADEMVGRGLEFLARSQQADGRWSLGRSAGQPTGEAPKLQSDTAATGLALLSFFGAGHDHFDGPHRDTVRRGLEFLLSIQKDDGDLYLPADDLSNSCSWLYSHGIASMALCEAVGMTGDAIVKPAAEKACRFIATSQHPQLGGWRYAPRSDADLSVSGWMLVALRSGQLAGVRTDDGTLAGVRRLLDASTTPADPTRYAYNPRNAQQRRSQLSSACMTAVGALMKLHTGTPKVDPGVLESARLLAALKPAYGTPKQRTRDSYLWYYSSQVLVHAGGSGWDPWYGSLVDTLAGTQETSGPATGSWDPLGAVPDRWGEYGGRLYVTALHLLALEVPARHLPTYSATAQPKP